MSRRLSAIALALGILVGATGLKAAITSHANGVTVANGPAPVPPLRPPTEVIRSAEKALRGTEPDRK